MKIITCPVLVGTLLLLSSVSFAGNIEVHKAKDIEVYKGNTVEIHKAKEIGPYNSKATKTDPAKEVKPAQGGVVQPAPAAGQVRPYTKKDLEQMHRNDVTAGRTQESIKKAGKQETKKGQQSIMFKDTYNSGGWNYNNNQSASPIYNPNSQ